LGGVLGIEGRVIHLIVTMTTLLLVEE